MKYLYLSLAGLLLAGAAHAQVTATTPDELSGIPAGFLPTAKVPNFAPRGTPKGYKVNPDPRDFTASYVEGGGGGGGGPPPGGAGGPPGGAPPGGAPSGAPPGGGAPGGAGPGGAAAGQTNANDCIPTLDLGNYATHIISSQGRLTVVGEMGHASQRFYIGASHPADVKPSYMGDSIAHWEGNALVTDTIAIKRQPGVRVVGRWTKQKDGSLNLVQTSFDASGKQTGPATTIQLVWRPDISFVEDICEDFGEAFGAGYGGNPAQPANGAQK